MSEDAAVPSGVRAGDADREATVTRLQAALGEGRIDIEEFSQRAGDAYAATTTAELDQLLADLPAPAAAGPAGGGVGGVRESREPVFSFMGDVKLAPATGVPRQIAPFLG